MRLKSKKEIRKMSRSAPCPPLSAPRYSLHLFSVSLFIVEPREPPVLAETTGWLAPPPTWFSFYSRPHLNTCTPGRLACWLTCPSITQGDSLLFEYMFGSRRWTPLRSLIASSRSLSGVLQFPTMPFFVPMSSKGRRHYTPLIAYSFILSPSVVTEYETNLWAV